MESPRARRLTTILVAICLGAGILALLVGVILSLSRPVDEWAPILAHAQVVPGLLAGDPRGWLSLGALLLILTPTARLVGMLLTFAAEANRKATGSALVVIGILLSALVLPALR